MMNLTIWAEAVTGALLLADVVMISGPRRARPRDAAGRGGF